MTAPLLALLVAAGGLADALTPAERAEATALIESFKENPRGPFVGVAWYCKDGTVQLPRSYACKERGGGIQHGVRGPQVERLAALGIPAGTVIAALTPQHLLADDYYRARALIIERFLERNDDGWVMRKARSYRGARQIEDEEAAAEVLLEDLAGRTALWKERRLLLLRLMRALPRKVRDPGVDEIRALAGELGDLDKKFEPVRSKIHSLPEASDVSAVKAYLATATGDRKARAATLLAKMEAHYDPAARQARLVRHARRIKDPALSGALRKLAESGGAPARERIRLALAVVRTAEKRLPGAPGGASRLLALDALNLAEETLVETAAALSREPLTRRQAADVLSELVDAGRAVGLISAREHAEVDRALEALLTGESSGYPAGLATLARVPEWGRARHLADLGLPLRRYQAVEPASHPVVDDLMRSGVLLPLAVVLDRFASDLDALRGGGHQLRGVPASMRVRGENPGLAVGPLVVVPPEGDVSGLRRHQVVLLHDLPPELPPVAGLVTVGSGGSLSHVSLLASNLGIPQVSVDSDGAALLGAWKDGDVVLGVSAARRVVLGRTGDFTEAERGRLGARSGATTRLSIDGGRLDLKAHRVMQLEEVRETDAGITVGPKAAELSRLKRMFPDRVSGAAVIPFGAWVRHVDRPAAGGGPSPLARLRAVWRRVASLPEEQAEREALAALAEMRSSIASLPFPEGFEAEVEAALARLGPPGSFGVFVRSDTNVEDLKDFTGAGLNLTAPNRVGTASVLAAIREVWASPYSERSYRWRQRLLANPEHVYPSVILHKTVPSEVSGVIVTVDLESGAPGAITISASEGIAAVVDGGAPEVVVVPSRGSPRLLASSRVATRRVVPAPPEEGLRVVPARGTDPLLSDAELREVASLVEEVVARMPAPDAGAAWDIEFGLVRSKAFLMQIRPLKPSKVAATHPYLLALDRSARPLPPRIDLEKELPR